MKRGRWLLLVGLAACGGAEGDAPPVDSTFVSALAELHLADARAALDSTVASRGTRAALADSLREQVFELHGLDAATLAERLDALAADPDLATATYDAVDSRLSFERQGATPPR